MFSPRSTIVRHLCSQRGLMAHYDRIVLYSLEKIKKNQIRKLPQRSGLNRVQKPPGAPVREFLQSPYFPPSLRTPGLAQYG